MLILRLRSAIIERGGAPLDHGSGRVSCVTKVEPGIPPIVVSFLYLARGLLVPSAPTTDLTASPFSLVRV